MATKKWSELPVASTLTGTEIIAVTQSSTTRRSTAAAIANTATSLAAFTSGAFAGASSGYSFDKGITGLFYVGAIQSLSGAGAVSIATSHTELTTTGANALTLAAGTAGQIKTITMIVDGGDGTLTPSALGVGTTITFNDVGDSVVLQYGTAKWWVLANNGCTIA